MQRRRHLDCRESAAGELKRATFFTQARQSPTSLCIAGSGFGDASRSGVAPLQDAILPAEQRPGRNPIQQRAPTDPFSFPHRDRATISGVSDIWATSQTSESEPLLEHIRDAWTLSYVENNCTAAIW